MTRSPPKPGRLSQAIRRLFPIYGHYRRLCVLVDRMSETERAAYQAGEIEKIERLAKSAGIATGPILTNRQVQQNSQAYLRKTLWPSVRATTGGTTGTPLILERSLNSVIYQQAMLDHTLALHGVELARGRMAVIRGDSVKHPDDLEPPYSVAAGPFQRIFSGFHLSDKTARAYLSEIAEFRPDVIYFYPSTLQILLRLVEETGIALRPKVVMTSSMVLPQELFAGVAAAFACPLLDWYGQGERVCAAWASEAGQYRFRPDHGQVILTNPGSRGSICGTAFHNRRQFLVNYSTGDLLLGADEMTDEELRAVALGVKPFAGLQGRQNDIMILPDGRQFAAFNQIGRYVEGADYLQILRTGLAELEVVVVKNRRYTEATLAQIKENIRARLPTTLKISYRFSEVPVRTASGKTPNYIDMFSSANQMRSAGDRG